MIKLPNVSLFRTSRWSEGRHGLRLQSWTNGPRSAWVLVQKLLKNIFGCFDKQKNYWKHILLVKCKGFFCWCMEFNSIELLFKHILFLVLLKLTLPSFSVGWDRSDSVWCRRPRSRRRSSPGRGPPTEPECRSKRLYENKVK